MTVRPSQYNPGNEVPEKNWFYRFAKQYWFNDFGGYRGRDHSRASAPAILRTAVSISETAGLSVGPAQRRDTPGRWVVPVVASGAVPAGSWTRWSGARRWAPRPERCSGTRSTGWGPAQGR